MGNMFINCHAWATWEPQKESGLACTQSRKRQCKLEFFDPSVIEEPTSTIHVKGGSQRKKLIERFSENNGPFQCKNGQGCADRLNATKLTSSCLARIELCCQDVNPYPGSSWQRICSCSSVIRSQIKENGKSSRNKNLTTMRWIWTPPRRPKKKREWTTTWLKLKVMKCNGLSGKI